MENMNNFCHNIRINLLLFKSNNGEYILFALCYIRLIFYINKQFRFKYKLNMKYDNKLIDLYLE